MKLKEPLPLPWDTQTNNILVTILFSSQHNPLQPLTKTLGEIKQGTMSLAANKQQTSGAKQQSLAANKQPTTRAKQQSLGSNRQPTTRAKQKQMMEVQETHCKKTSIASAPIRITQMKIPNMVCIVKYEHVCMYIISFRTKRKKTSLQYFLMNIQYLWYDVCT